MQDQQSWPQPKVVARVRSSNSLHNTSHNGSVTGSPTVRHQPYGNMTHQPPPPQRGPGSPPFGSLNNSINGNPLSPPPPPLNGVSSGSFAHNAPLPPAAVPMAQQKSPNQSFEGQGSFGNNGRSQATQRMMEGYGFAPIRNQRGYNQQQVHQHLNNSGSTNGGPNGSPQLDGSLTRNPYVMPPQPHQHQPGSPSSPMHPSSNNGSFHHSSGNNHSFNNQHAPAPISFGNGNGSFQNAHPAPGYSHHANGGFYDATNLHQSHQPSYMQQPPPPPPIQPYNNGASRPPTYNSNYSANNQPQPPYNAYHGNNGQYHPQQPPYPQQQQQQGHVDQPTNYPTYYQPQQQQQQQQPAPSYHQFPPKQHHQHQKSSHSSQNQSRGPTSPGPQTVRNRSDSLGSIGSVGVAMAGFSPDASDARSQGAATPNSLSGTFVLGSGSQPLPFDSPTDLNNPLKDKWDRRRKVHRQHLGKSVIFPSEVVTVRNAAEIAEMVDGIRADVRVAHRLLDEAKMRGEKEIADKAAGIPAASAAKAGPDDETASHEAEVGSGGGSPCESDSDESDKVSASTAPTINSALGLGRRTPQSVVGPRSMRKPAPPPGHKSFRDCLRLRQRTFIAIHLIGVDSSKLSNLYLILIATATKTYVIDMTEMQSDDFRSCKLAELFEDPLVTKITFDCRPDVEVLQRQFGVVLRGVCDLQVMATLSISPRGQFMIGRKAMFQRLFLLSQQDEELKERITVTGLPTQAIPNVGQFPAPAVECCIIDLKYLFVAFFMLDFYESGGRTIGDQRVQNTLAGFYNKSTQRDF